MRPLFGAMATRQAGRQIDEARYLEWFSWAQASLGRDLEATHAAAEAGYQMQETGGTRESAEAAARAAGTAPQFVDPRSIALAEWAHWARRRFQTDAAWALQAAGRALTTLESTHSLEAAVAAVEPPERALRATAPATPQRHPDAVAASASTGFWRRNWQPVVGLMVASAIIAAIVTAGAISTFSPARLPVTQQGESPAIEVNVDPNGGAIATLLGFPPDRDVYILVDSTEVEMVHTDSLGSAVATFTFPPGGHSVRGCFDPTGGYRLAPSFSTGAP